MDALFLPSIGKVRAAAIGAILFSACALAVIAGFVKDVEKTHGGE